LCSRLPADYLVLLLDFGHAASLLEVDTVKGYLGFVATSSGKAPLDVAEGNGHVDVVALLK
jgi:hypothetical protein